MYYQVVKCIGRLKNLNQMQINDFRRKLIKYFETRKGIGIRTSLIQLIIIEIYYIQHTKAYFIQPILSKIKQILEITKHHKITMLFVLHR